MRRTRADWRLTSLMALLMVMGGCAGTSPAPEAFAPQQPPAAAERTPSQRATEPDEPPNRAVVKPSHPVRYTVKPGDTLWDIAARFLQDPWVWPEIWQVNPRIENPHLIYPGDVITLAWVGGEPRLRVERPGLGPSADPGQNASGRDVERLQPRVRREPLADAIPSIPADAIRQFLNRPAVATAEQIEGAPYVLGNYEGRLISAAGSEIFAKNFPDGRPSATRYSVVRPGEPLRDPASGDLLGYELVHAGKAKVLAPGPPARLLLTDSSREILSGDHLIPPGRGISQARYIPHAPEQEVEGQIIHLVDAISQVGTKQVVVINLGQREGLEIGHVLAIEQSGGTVQDPRAAPGEDARIALPPQRVGTLMLFKVFDRLAYALVLDATRAIHLHDSVVRP